MMAGIARELGARIKANLTTLDSQPIGRGTLVVLMFLNLFILSSIFEGLSNHTRQLTQPHQYAPQVCRNIVLNGGWAEEIRLWRLAEKTPLRKRDADLADRLHPQCAQLDQLLQTVVSHPIVKKDLLELKATRVRVDAVNQRLQDVNNAYQNELLESLASAQDDTRADAVRNEAQLRSGNLNESIKNQRRLEQRIAAYPEVAELFAHVTAISETDRDMLREDLRHFSFWFPVRRLGMEMIFLAPLVLLFWLWNRWALSRDSSFQILISSHLLLVVFVPVLLMLLELIYDILPERLLEDVLALLESLNIIAIWYYLMIIIGVGVAMTVIYYINKKLFSFDRLVARRIQKGQCQQCGVRLASGSKACADCGFRQFIDCSSCGEQTYVHSAFCTSCGASRS